MSIQLDLINDILRDSIVSQKDVIYETLFVDTNPAQVDIVKVMKVNSVVTRVSESNNYILNTQKFTFNKFDKEQIVNEIGLSLDNFFIKSLEESSEEETLKYYKKGILNIFKRNKPEEIINQISEYCNWIITSNKVINQLSKLDSFDAVYNDNISTIELRGRINNIKIFRSDDIDSNTIYIGHSSDCSSVFLKEIILNSNIINIYETDVNYLFINKGVRKLILE
jgi:hypothetical protein